MGLFKKKTKEVKPEPLVPATPQEYPSGLAVVTDKGRFLIHKDGKRYRISSDEVFNSWNFPRVVVTSEAALANYPIAYSKLPFRDGTLLNNIADGKMYLVSESKLRHIVHPAVLWRLNVDRNDFLLVADSDIKIMKQGEDIT